MKAPSNAWLADAIAAANDQLGDCGLFAESRAMLREIYFLLPSYETQKWFTVIKFFITSVDTKKDVVDICRDFLWQAYREFEGVSPSSAITVSLEEVFK